MEEYGKILLIAMPTFLVLVLLEKLYGYLKGSDTVPLDDAVSSLSSGMTNVLKDVLGLSIGIISYEWLFSKLAVFSIQNTIVVYAIAFIVIDFYGYWSHRFAHKVNLFWNHHVIHHSSEEFNLACALRQPISGVFKFFTFLLIPAAIMGVPPKVIAIVLPLHLFMQFWYHTRHIGKLGFIEYILVTPSHHRVHHAINPEYLDKNLSQIFIFWDFLFGTFQEELEEVPPVFGISRPALTWNPFKINFQHFFVLSRDALKTKNLADKLTIWFRPTGWRPKGFDDLYPLHKIEDVNSFSKYKPTLSKFHLFWGITHLLVVMFFLLDLFSRLGSLSFTHILIYGGYIFLTIYSLTDLMDKNKWNCLFEIFRFSLLVAIGLWMKTWFGYSTLLYLVFVYQMIALSISIVFYINVNKDNASVAY